MTHTVTGLAIWSDHTAYIITATGNVVCRTEGNKRIELLTKLRRHRPNLAAVVHGAGAMWVGCYQDHHAKAIAAYHRGECRLITPKISDAAINL